MWHALARDVWPHLSLCVAPAGVRGYANVEIHDELGGRVVRFAGAPLARETPLRRCVQRVVERLVLPPREDDTRSPHVAFDLVFNLEPLRTSPRPRAREPRPRRPFAAGLPAW